MSHALLKALSAEEMTAFTKALVRAMVRRGHAVKYSDVQVMMAEATGFRDVNAYTKAVREVRKDTGDLSWGPFLRTEPYIRSYSTGSFQWGFVMVNDSDRTRDLMIRVGYAKTIDEAWAAAIAYLTRDDGYTGPIVTDMFGVPVTLAERQRAFAIIDNHPDDDDHDPDLPEAEMIHRSYADNDREEFYRTDLGQVFRVTDRLGASIYVYDEDDEDLADLLNDIDDDEDDSDDED